MENEAQPITPLTQSLPQNPAPTPPSTNLLKITLFTVLGLVVVSGSVFAGIQIGKNQLVSQELALVEQTATPTQIVADLTVQQTTPSPTIDETASWETYSNSKYGFSFKYPLDYKVTTSPVTGNQYNIVVDKKINANGAGLVPIQLSINMGTGESGTPLVLSTIKEAEAHYIKSFNSSSVSKKDITVANLPAVSITGVLAGPGPGEGNFLHYTLVKLDNEILVIQLGNKNYQNVFDQIISTFKLTN